MSESLENRAIMTADDVENGKMANVEEPASGAVDASMPERKDLDAKADEVVEVDDGAQELGYQTESDFGSEGPTDSGEEEEDEHGFWEAEIDENTPNGVIKPAFSKPIIEKAKQVMNVAPRDSLRIARSGDVEMMQYVLAGIELIPPHLAGYACDVICHHLRSNPPPMGVSDEGEITKEEKLAILSMVTLFYFLDVFKTSDVIDTFRLAWKSIVRWMQYFVGKYLKQHAEIESGNLIESIAGTLYFASKMDKKLEKSICSDFAMNKLVASLWTSSYSGADSRGYASLVLTTVLEYSPEVASTVQNILFLLCHIPDVVVSKLIEERLVRARDFQRLNAYASLAVAFCTEATENMMYNMWKDDGVYEVCGVLKRCLRESPPPGDTDYERACAAYAQLVTFVIRMLDCIVGQAIVSHALVSDFLESLALVGPKFDSLRMQPIKRLVTRFLSEVLPRIIMRKEKTDGFLKAVGAAMIPGIKLVAMESSFARDWTLLELFVRERAAYEVFYRKREDLGLILKPRACANPVCDKADPEKTFKLCSACKSVVYCSAQCQGTHWKTSHKVICKKRREKPQQKGNSTYVDNFNAYCVRRDIIRYLPGLRKLAQEKFPSIPFGSIGIDIDYTIVPPAFNAFLLEDLSSDPDRDIADQASRLHQRAQDGKDDSILARVVRSRKVRPNYFKDTTDKTYTEVLISNVDEFAAENKSSGEKVPRLVCQDDQSQELETVTYDRVDEFLSSLVPEGTTKMDDGVLSLVMRNLRECLEKMAKSKGS